MPRAAARHRHDRSGRSSTPGARRPTAALAALAILAATLIAVAPGHLRPAAATSTTGTDFWVTFPANLNSERLQLFITSGSSTTGTVSGAAIASPLAFSVTAGQVTTVDLPLAAVVTTLGTSNGGIRIAAADPVTVYGINQRSATTDGFLAIPVDALGTRYRIASLSGGQYAVVATADGTTVSVDGASIGTLNAGQVHLARPGTDPSGTLITSSQPVAVFAGHQCSSLPGGGACDHQTEQLPPTDAWGSDFVVLRYANRNDVGDFFRVVADQDATEVSIDGTVVATLNAGQMHQFERFRLNGASTINGGRVTTSKPALLVQFMRWGTYGSGGSTVTGDPAMSVIPPFEQFQTSYTLATMASGFAYNAVNVVLPTVAVPGFRLDGAAVPAGTFEAIGSTGFSGAQIEIAPGTYSLTAGQPFGVFLYGANSFDSYAVPGGMSLSPVALISSVILGASVTTGTVNGTPSVCFAATVADSASDPLDGIRVDFALTGELTVTGAATTGPDGVATFCTENSSSTGGVVNVVATVAALSDSDALTISAAGPGPPAPPSPRPPAPLAESVGIAVEEATNLAGASSVLVRGSVPVPTTTTVRGDAGPNGGMIIADEAGTTTVTVTTTSGATETSGVVTPVNGEVVCEICARLAAGSVVEAWVYSEPRLTAAVRVDVDAEEGTCPFLRIPVGTPLDGGDALEPGVHTVQLRMYTDNGFEVLAFPITVGGPVPTGVPSGEGPLGTSYGMLLLLASLTGLGVLAGLGPWARRAREGT